MNKIKRISLFFSIIFQIAFVGIILSEILTWLFAPQSLFALKANGFYMIPLSYFANLADSKHMMPLIFTPLTKFLCFLVNMIPASIELFILYSLIQLFRLYQKGNIFALQNVRYIRNVGYGLLATQLISPIYQALIGMALTSQNPPGHHFAMFGISTTDLGMILIAFLIILVSWIMAEGCKLHDDQQLTI
jgi:hypothetical protein